MSMSQLYVLPNIIGSKGSQKITSFSYLIMYMLYMILIETSLMLCRCLF